MMFGTKLGVTFNLIPLLIEISYTPKGCQVSFYLDCALLPECGPIFLFELV